MSDNGFLQIFYNVLTIVLKYFLGTIEHLVCRKMCCKNFENWMTKQFWSESFSVQNGKGGKYFLSKILNA